MPSLSGSRGWLERSATKGVPEQEVSVDSFLVNVLRPHQRRGVVFLYECLMGIKVANHYGAILADEMGLGKTLQCITVIWTMLRKGPYGEPVVKRVLVVTPSSLCDNWNAEFTRWLGSHRISPYVVDGKRRRAKDFTKQPRNTVMIISYDTLIRNREDIEGMSFNLVVCDEGHRLKNCDVKAAKFLRGMACRRRVLLTGTPIQNDLQEFFALVDLVNPGILGTSQSYKTEYETPIVASRSPSATNVVVETGSLKARQLHDLTKPFTLRRTQDTIDKYMPSKHEIVVLCRLSQEQERLYKLVTDSWFRNVVLPGNNVPHLTVITSLKKICNHVDLFTTGEMEFFSDSRVPEIGKRKTNEYCGKVTIVRTLMRSLKGTDEKLVLVSYYTKTLDLLEVVCNGEGLPFLRLDGSTVTAVRSKIVAQFNTATNDHKVFLLSGKAGGVGLNLPGGSRLVLFDSDWNPASDAQAMARIWREGQKRDVYIYRLLTTGTIEEKIFQRQISKTGLSETIVDQNSFDSLKFSLDELRDLFTLTTETNCLTHDLMKCRCEGKGRKREERSNDELELEEERDCQFLLQERPSQPNITINQLLEWEHYERPISQEVMKDIMLDESAGHVSFLFKNSRLRRNRD